MISKKQVKIAAKMIKNNRSPDYCDPMELKIVEEWMVTEGIIHMAVSFGNPHAFCLTQLGTDLSKFSEKKIVKCIMPKNQSKGIAEHFMSWYGLLGTTVTIIGFWIMGWQIWHWWFLGL